MSLDFDHADDRQATGQFDCGLCKKVILDQYFQANDLSMCGPCKDNYFAEKPGCSGYFRAAAFGFVGAILGALIDLLVTVLTGYQLGLIAIVMGWLVGAAVNLGARGRGGALFQILAMGFTYFAICGSLSGQVIRELANGALDEPTPVVTSSPGVDAPAPPSPSESPVATDLPTPDPEASASPVVAESETVVTTEGQEFEAEDDVNPLAMLMVGLGLCLALPILIGMENPMTLLIYAFAIYQAWSMTRRVNIEGPFTVSSQAGETDSASASDSPE